ncbi:MAG: recombinase family protein [Hahellaceae bacterium]|nr:recombinase family protein [Hahellaceae bacterium]
MTKQAVFGYARVSTNDQNPQMQIDAIKKRYPEALVREEKVSGTKSSTERPVLNLLLDMISKGDKLVVWKLDRLGRNLADLLKIVEILKNKEASLEIMDKAIDTSKASDNAFLQMLGVFAEFETNLRKERQLEGIQKAKKEGKYKGQPKSINREKIAQMRTDGLSPTAIAKKLEIGRASVYRIFAEIDQEQKAS